MLSTERKKEIDAFRSNAIRRNLEKFTVVRMERFKNNDNSIIAPFLLNEQRKICSPDLERR